MSSFRSQARRLALQVLYSNEYQDQNGEGVEAAMAIAAPKAPKDVRAYAKELIEGVLAQKDALDERIAARSDRWKLERIHPVELDILRIGLFEITFRTDVPAKVGINEAVDLAKRFGDDEAWRLVNGILDELAKGRLEEERKTDSD